MINTLPESMTMTEFLEWWNNHPLVFGGDKYSAQPGMALYLIQGSDFEHFFVNVEPIQPDRPNTTIRLLSTLLDDELNDEVIYIEIKDDTQFVAQIELRISEDRRQAWGEGEWLSLDTKPSLWKWSHRLH